MEIPLSLTEIPSLPLSSLERAKRAMKVLVYEMAGSASATVMSREIEEAGADIVLLFHAQRCHELALPQYGCVYGQTLAILFRVATIGEPDDHGLCEVPDAEAELGLRAVFYGFQVAVLRAPRTTRQLAYGAAWARRQDEAVESVLVVQPRGRFEPHVYTVAGFTPSEPPAATYHCWHRGAVPKHKLLFGAAPSGMYYLAG